eukprot:gene5706-6591_t
MVKSKRSKVVSLTQVTKNPGEKKKRLVSTVREYLEEADWSSSKFLFGKKTVLSVGLGRSPAEETKPGLHKLSENLQGECALFFTNDDKNTVLSYFNTYSETDFARAGFIPEETITKKAGSIEMTHTQEPYLRRLGMPTSLKHGVILMESDYDLCEKGVALTPDQARLLQLFDIKLSEFKFNLLGYWNDGDYTALQAASSIKKDEDEEEDEEDDE